MFQIKIGFLFALALQIFALPEYIPNLERDLAALPEEYKYLAEELITKREANNERDTNGYCCKNWQHINNDEVHTKVQTTQVPKTHVVVVGYQDCDGNINATRPPIAIPSTTPGTGFQPGFRPPTLTPGSQTSCTWTPITKIETYMTVESAIVTYLVPNSQTYCAPEDYHCCANYIMLNNNCIHQSAIANLEYLIQLGLISGIGK